jgi:hypothetical protein
MTRLSLPGGSRNPACPTCGFVLRSSALFWSGGQRYWSVLPHDRAAYAAACLQNREGFGIRIESCTQMRKSLDPAAEGAPSPEHPPSVRRTLSTREVMDCFVSLGDNCELGLAQRWANTEPVDLLRFAIFQDDAENLLKATTAGIEHGFAGLGDAASLICALEGVSPRREYVVRETRWKLLAHTNIHEGEIDPQTLHRMQVKSWQLKQRKLLMDMEAARRIFVWKSNAEPPEAEIRALLAALRQYGPNRLLWVVAADPDHPAGSVENAGDGLLKGYIVRFAPYEDATLLDPDAWHSLCRNALAAAES